MNFSHQIDRILHQSFPEGAPRSFFTEVAIPTDATASQLFHAEIGRRNDLTLFRCRELIIRQFEAAIRKWKTGAA